MFSFYLHSLKHVDRLLSDKHTKSVLIEISGSALAIASLEDPSFEIIQYFLTLLMKGHHSNICFD